jgi:hypothetical protein
MPLDVSCGSVPDWLVVSVFSGLGVFELSRVAGLGGPSWGRWVFRGSRCWWVGGQGKAARMRCQAVAIAVAQRQVASMRSRSWRAPRVIRAAVCKTR